MGSTPRFVEFANVAIPRGEPFIELGRLAGTFVRLTAFFGAGHTSVRTATSRATMSWADARRALPRPRVISACLPLNEIAIGLPLL